VSKFESEYQHQKQMHFFLKHFLQKLKDTLQFVYI